MISLGERSVSGWEDIRVLRVQESRRWLRKETIS